MPLPVTTISGLQIVGAKNNDAGTGVLAYIVPTPIADIWQINGLKTVVGNIDMSATINGTPFNLSMSSGNYVNSDAIALQTALHDAGFTYLTVTKESATAGSNLIISSTQPLTITDFSLSGAGLSAIGDPALTHVQESETPPSLLSWFAPNDTEAGAEVAVSEGVMTLTSANGGAELTVNVSLADLPTESISENIVFTESQLIKVAKWFVRRRSSIENPLQASIVVNFSNGDSITVTSSSSKPTDWLTLNLSSNALPSTAVLTAGVGEAGTLYIAYEASDGSKVSWGRKEYSNGATVFLEHNDAPVSKDLRDLAFDRIRTGNYSGDVMDAIRIVTASDDEAFLVLSMLTAGTNYLELTAAGISTMTATQVLSIWYSVPSAEQQLQTALIAQMAKIRDMSTAQLIDFLTWANTNSVQLPLMDIKQMLAMPTYSPDNASAISGYLETI